MYEKYWNKKYIEPELERMMKMRLRIFLVVRSNEIIERKNISSEN